MEIPKLSLDIAISFKYKNVRHFRACGVRHRLKANILPDRHTIQDQNLMIKELKDDVKETGLLLVQKTISYFGSTPAEGSSGSPPSPLLPIVAIPDIKNILSGLRPGTWIFPKASIKRQVINLQP
ncbi:MAG: hypothetical protein MI975_06730 [Cytophagales bacterium]|nr:hypothetical protein [Cytophagales bacterium]